ncbi:Magnesium transporter MgtE [Rubripirellula amarantea]|uniref:Magnesium transporter MgtE n=1 Tax=Rubripirellula amarantea TaxID=2527999 RepID=A0A5C5WUV5_9BACT|nr:magnesium transporter [Rubripirellula amarantea]TWT54744.1 Magnesium transporter MgtE [Rubripirellula amarantea]
MTEPAVESDTRPWEELLKLARQGDESELSDYLASLPPTDQAFAFAHLDDEDAELIVNTLSVSHAAELLSRLSEAQAAGLVGTLSPQLAAAIVHELPSDEQADVLGELADDQVGAILDQLPEDEATDLREFIAYNDEVAGGLMNRELIRIPLNETIGGVIRIIESALERLTEGDVRYGYVVDDSDRLVGVLPMQNLLFSKRSTAVGDVMIREPMTVHDQTPLDDLIDVFDSYNFLGIPVVDADQKLVGVVLRQSVDYAAGQAAESDYLKSQGIVGGEELRTMPLWLRSRRRLSWLSVNILLNVGAASVVAFFQDTLQSVIALAVFLPIISDMSGCSGNQAVAVSMRELSLGLLRPTEVLRVWIQELGVGLINGAVLGLLVAIAALLYNGNGYLGLVVGTALFANTIVAVSIGGTVPLIVKRFGFDPAIASGPLLTTITDMCGFFLVLGIASQMIDKLTQ